MLHHLTVPIDRPVREVYDYVRDPANLRKWALGIDPEARVLFAPENSYGVLDHTVTLPGGETIEVPVRVLADGDGCEVMFTLRDAAEADREAVRADLDRLGQRLITDMSG